jgi:V8-like Glu-specific endopeptidase
MTEDHDSGPIPLIEATTPKSPSSMNRQDAPSKKRSRSDLVPFKLITGARLRATVGDTGVSPWNAIGLLNLTMQGQAVLVGSGFMCAPDVFLTARHNLTTKAFDAAGVWIAYDEVKNRTAQRAIKARELHPTLDLAVLILATNQPATIALGSNDRPTNVSIGGYGFPYADGTMQMSAAGGLVTGTNAPYIGYGVNTEEGDSGAPVLIEEQSGRLKALAVHTTSEGGLLNSNFGILLTPEVIENIYQLIQRARSYA